MYEEEEEMILESLFYDNFSPVEQVCPEDYQKAEETGQRQ